MVEPLRKPVDYVGVGRKILAVEPLPEGYPVRYEWDTTPNCRIDTADVKGIEVKITEVRAQGAHRSPKPVGEGSSPSGKEIEMALADYYLCDVCKSKTFYDGNLPYGEYQDGIQQNPKTGHPWPDGNVGDMAVLCRECAKTHTITIACHLVGKSERK